MDKKEKQKQYKIFEQNTEDNVFNMIEEIDKDKVLLPLIQRDFVWSDEQIVNLFDSIYRGYPIGSFLIWKAGVRDIKRMKFSRVIRFYNPYLSSIKIFEPKRKKGPFNIVLDGQQRITALYIGLKGLYGEKSPGRGTYVIWKGLFINLLETDKSKESEIFKFFPIYGVNINEAKVKEIWRTCFTYISNGKKEAIDMRNKDLADKCIEDLEKNLFSETRYLEEVYPDFCKNKCSKQLWFPLWELYKLTKRYDKERTCSSIIETIKDLTKDFHRRRVKNAEKKIERTIKRFLGTFRDEDVLHYYVIKDNDLNKMFEVFNRVNTGGTFLSKSDVIFGYIVSNWNDAKEKFNNLLDKINQKIHGTSKDGFDMDFLIRTMLMIVPNSKNNKYRPVTPKVDEILKDRTLPTDIEENWDKIEDSIMKVIELISDIGIYNDDLPSKNVLIPVIYFVYNNPHYKIMILDLDKVSSNNIETLKELLKYVFSSLLNKVFSSHGDRLLENLRRILKNKKEFKYMDIAMELERIMPEKNLRVDFSIIEDEAKQQYARIALKALWIFKELEKAKEANTLSKLRGITRDLEVDHIFAKSLFTKNNKKKKDAIAKFVNTYFNKSNEGTSKGDYAQEMFKNFFEKNRYEFGTEEVLKKEEELRKWLENKFEYWVEQLPNKMLLKSRQNKIKNTQLLLDYLEEAGYTDNEKEELFEYGYIPEEYRTNLTEEDFIFFYLKRYQKLEKAFNKIFGNDGKS